MNLTQWLLLLAPVALFYVLYVCRGESNGRITPWANLLTGLILVPVVLFCLPVLLLGAMIEALRVRRWGKAGAVFLALLVIASYGAAIIHLRDRPPPLPAELPVER